ncbi:MAG TPA: MBL fold metallo-hydrolase [Pyrinomonadaceae bacterium]|nr:MBL fold metallo-hydrolase [Pyrinomonadaceae bacterium]
MKFTVLGSGSTGNAVLITAGKTKVLVDSGLSAKEIVRRCGEVGVDVADLDAILITHEHSDHAGGLRVLLKSVRCPVYMSGETLEAYLFEKRHVKPDEGVKRTDAIKGKVVEIASSREFRIGEIDFEPFSVPHDAADNFGFIAKHCGVRLAALTDFGHMTTLISQKLRGCDAIIIESNHSLPMLKACPIYSWDLKQRISSRTGHLSNEDLAAWLTNDFDGTARHIVLAHLSQKANEPHLARLTAEQALRERAPLFKVETKIILTHHKEPTEWIEF